MQVEELSRIVRSYFVVLFPIQRNKNVRQENMIAILMRCAQKPTIRLSAAVKPGTVEMERIAMVGYNIDIHSENLT